MRSDNEKELRAKILPGKFPISREFWAAKLCTAGDDGAVIVTEWYSKKNTATVEKSPYFYGSSVGKLLYYLPPPAVVGEPLVPNLLDALAGQSKQGSFWRNQWNAIIAADMNNLRALRRAFPRQVDAYCIYAGVSL